MLDVDTRWKDETVDIETERVGPSPHRQRINTVFLFSMLAVFIALDAAWAITMMGRN